MNTLHANIKLVDDDSQNRIEDLVIEYNRRICVERTFKSSEGAITFNFSDLGNMLALYIHTSSMITVNNGSDIIVRDDLLLLNSSVGASITIQNKDATKDAVVSLRAYGVAT